jgi:hypothetical protein
MENNTTTARKRQRNIDDDFVGFLKNNAKISPNKLKCNYAHFLFENMDCSLSEFSYFEDWFGAPDFPYFEFKNDECVHNTRYSIDEFRKWCNSQPKYNHHFIQYAYQVVGMTTNLYIILHFMEQPDYEKVLSQPILYSSTFFEENIKHIITNKIDKKMIMQKVEFFAFFPRKIRSNYENCKISAQFGDTSDYVYWLIPEEKLWNFYQCKIIYILEIIQRRLNKNV